MRCFEVLFRDLADVVLCSPGLPRRLVARKHPLCSYSPTLPPAAASDATRRLSKSTSAEPGYSRARTTLFPATAISTLVIMSAESSAFQNILDDDLADTFEIVEASAPSIESLQQWKKVLQLESNDPYDEDEEVGKTEEPKSEASTILTTFTQTTFNALPLSLRVHLTRYFLRDLTTLSLFADAFLISGWSFLFLSPATR